jgi:hypothetical protein
MPVRLALGVVLLLAAIAAGAAPGATALAFAVGAGVVAFAALADRRGLLLHGAVEPERLPEDAVQEPRWRVVAAAAYPSTVGVSVLGAIALVAGKDVLGALLGGVVAGLAIASGVGLVQLVIWERARGARLSVASDGRQFLRE